MNSNAKKSSNFTFIGPLRGILFLFFLTVDLYSFDWPIPNGKAIKNFGLNEKGQAERGILFIHEDSIFPSDTGELLFSNSNKNRGSVLQPLGNWIALQHQDELVGIYSNLSDFDSEALPSIIDKAIPLARAGNSGWASGSQMQFSVYDRKTSGYVNPQLLINMLDTRPPLIRQTMLISRDGQRVRLGQTTSVRQGIYQVYVDAYDTADLFGNNQVAPYQFSLFINGTLQGQLDLDMLSARDGKLLVSLRKGQNTEMVYQSDGTYLLGEIRLNRGKVLCEVIVADTAGNRNNRTYHLLVE